MSGFDARKYWQDKGTNYRDTMQTEYHKNRLSMVNSLLEDSAHLAGSVLDFGCGDGELSERVLEAGGNVSCVDIDSQMVESTGTRLSAWTKAKSSQEGGKFSVAQGGVETLAHLPDGFFSTVLAINVLAYLSESEEREFYTQTHRILRGELDSHSLKRVV